QGSPAGPVEEVARRPPRDAGVASSGKSPDGGPNPTSTLVANSAEGVGNPGDPFAGGPILPRLRLGGPRREFATRVIVGFTSRGEGCHHRPPRRGRHGQALMIVEVGSCSSSVWTSSKTVHHRTW